MQWWALSVASSDGYVALGQSNAMAEPPFRQWAGEPSPPPSSIETDGHCHTSSLGNQSGGPLHRVWFILCQG
jgi:hypothetical protein